MSDSTEKTITVQGYFRERQLTKEEYVKRWEDHMRELMSLSWAHTEEFNKMTSRVKEIAEEEFDRLFARESAK